MKLPESTDTCARPAAGRRGAIVSVRGSIRSGRRRRRRTARRATGPLGDRAAGPRRCGTRSPRAATSRRRRPRRPAARPRPRRSRSVALRARARRDRRPPGRRRRPAAISRPCRIVHMFSVQPQPTIRSAPRISSAASGVAKPPETSSDHGLAVEQALRHGRRRQQRAAAVGEPLERLAAAGSAGAPAGHEHRPLGRAQRGGEPLQVRSVRRHRRRAVGDGAGAAGPVSSVCTSSGRFSSTVRRSPTAVATAAAACATAVVRRGDAHRDRADRGGQRRLVDVEVRAGPGRLGRDTISGVRLFAASVMPVIALVSPQPWCTVTRRHPPLIRA